MAECIKKKNAPPGVTADATLKNEVHTDYQSVERSTKNGVSFNTTLARTKNITAAVVAQNDGLKYVYQSNGRQMPAMPAALLYDQRAEIQGLTQKLRKGIITSSEHVKKCEELYIKFITDEYTKGCVIQDGRRKN